MNSLKLVAGLVAGFLLPSGNISIAQQAQRPFTVADEIGLALFGTPVGDPPKVSFSPDKKYFAVWTERGRLELNRPEDALRFYRSQDVIKVLEHPNDLQTPLPAWVVALSTAKEGPIINNWRWLDDSSAVVFLERTAEGNQQLVLADLRKKKIEPLTAASESVRDFGARDRRHYVYTVTNPPERRKSPNEHQAPAIVGTGRSLWQLILPDIPWAKSDSPSGELWAVVGSRRFKVKHDAMPIVPSGDLILSPDSGSLATELQVPVVPSSWATLYPPPFATSPYRIQASRTVREYVRIDLKTGSIRALTDAPISNDAGWWVDGQPSWSKDGQRVVLPGTFIAAKDGVPSRPCVAVVDLFSNLRNCVEVLKGHTETGVEEGYHSVKDARFVEGDKRRVLVSFSNHTVNNRDYSVRASEYREIADGGWQLVNRDAQEGEARNSKLEVAVKQAFNEPPELVATEKQRSHIIWNPNPQLKGIELGEASVYTWKDTEGRNWSGGLYKPLNYQIGQRYPLVIQNHGFDESEFRPSGVFPTAFAAMALAAGGIAVLQVDGSCPIPASNEGSCSVAGYEAAVKQLASDGLVDPERIGIVGFSRTCFYVMETLTTSSLHIKAASITDGVMEDYFQYMLLVFPNEADSMIGARPFGAGLQEWLKRSPGFNLDKITAPLLVVGEGPGSLLTMWEPYAGLRYLNKPVDLVMLNTTEHVLTNPAVRMASQGGTVDWFRFWLQSYEDPDPAKAQQYRRWRELRILQGKIAH
jgi:dipeptidyl aminopeptidase/acylaminoacyl peptidase